MKTLLPNITANMSLGVIVFGISALVHPVTQAQSLINNVVHIQNLGLGQKTSDDINRLQDIQIGESGRFLRVVLFCRTACDVSERRDGYFLADIKDEIMIDIADQSKNAKRLTMISETSGSLLAIKSQKSVLRSSVKRCEVQNTNAVCIDLEYAAKPFQSEIIAREKNDARKKNDTLTASAPNITRNKPASPQAALRSSVPSSNSQDALNSNVTLRAGTTQNVGQVTRQAAKQTPSTFPTRPFKNSNSIEATSVSATTPSPLRNGSVLRPVETNLVLSRVDFREHSETILGKRFDSENCDIAKAKLQNDAWALDAMQTVGFCVGAKGDFEQAETIFKTLLTQDDKNFEAMIGRGLIARVTGEKSVSKRFFEDALKANAPKRIETRMRAVLSDF